MKLRTSLSLDPAAAATARAHAALADVNMSAWVDRAIHHLAAEEDLAVYDRWRAAWSPEDQAIEAAFEAADCAADLSA
jgi:hypothetical protein